MSNILIKRNQEAENQRLTFCQNDHNDLGHCDKADSLKNSIRAPERRTQLERKAEIKVGPDKVNMIFANPKSEFILAALARVLTFVFRGVNTHPSQKFENISDFINPSKLSVDELLDVRKKSI